MQKKYNKQFPYVILSIVILSLLSCSKKEPRRYYYKDKGFSIKMPDTWEIKENYQGATIMGLIPFSEVHKQFRANCSVGIETLPDTMNLNNYFQTTLNELKKVFPDYKEEQKSDIKVNEYNGKIIIYTHKLTNYEIKIIQYFFINKTNVFCITGITQPYEFNYYKPIFDEIVQSLKFE